jgi:hypothetical protein
MIEVEQTIMSPPDGNCFAACLASILELPLEVVPNLARFWHDGEWDRAWNKQQRWLERFGLRVTWAEPSDAKDWRPEGYWISTNNVGQGEHDQHATVWRGHEMVWNPCPGSKADGSDLGACTLIEYFIALDPAKIARTLSSA